MSDLARWLDGRRPEAPPSLRQAVREAIERGDPGAGPLPERLAEAALHALGRVVAEPSTRTQALELLAADALLTYACEAALEEAAQGAPQAARKGRAAGPAGQGGEAGSEHVAAPDAVARLTSVLGLHRFAELLAKVPDR